ncbi:hypothetical protein F8M41_019620 [Gigaspora margarita]|uniref:DUF7729 domain-containing protein n=1 Tax=Gigaspora margarita TaxID=4874 RepID=A0A8H4EKI6_GIGMA|nr:hypothetical protein F8M41_019620 [Gigaspora margarita]
MKFLQISSLFVFALVAFSFVSSQQPQLPTNLSSTCLTEIAKLLGNSEFKNCASFIKLIPLQTSKNDRKQILDSYCSAPKCNDNITSAAATDVKSQCATDLAAKDYVSFALKGSMVFNPVMKDALCLKNSSGGYCELDPKSEGILGYIGGLNVTPPTDTDFDIICNDCNKAIINSFVNYFKAHPETTAELSADPTPFENWFTTKCGASFLDGTIPTSSTSTNTTTSSGISMHSSFFTGFTMFANTIIIASFIILIAYAI